MRNKVLIFILSVLFTVSCASIPKETVSLSTAIGNDLKTYHNAHRNTVKLYYERITNDINTFIDDVYTPFIIHSVLKSELEKYQKGEASLYGSIILAGKDSSKQVAEEALLIMVEFQEDAHTQISSMRSELLEPIVNQEKEILNALDLSYQNTIYANTTLTTYLVSAQKVKEAQKELLSMIGLNGMNTVVTDKLVKLSESIDDVIKKSEKIDAQSDDAYQKVNDTISKIKELTNKK